MPTEAVTGTMHLHSANPNLTFQVPDDEEDPDAEEDSEAGDEAGDPGAPGEADEPRVDGQ